MTHTYDHLLAPPAPPLGGAGRRHDSDAATAALIAHLCAFAVGISPRELARPTRAGAAACRARQVAMYLAHTGLSWPLSRVAGAFGRDRTTAGHACARVEDWRDDPQFDASLAELETCLRAAPACAALAPQASGGAA